MDKDDKKVPPGGHSSQGSAQHDPNVRTRQCLVPHEGKHLSREAHMVLTTARRPNELAETNVLFCKVDFFNGEDVYFEEFGDHVFHAEAKAIIRLKLYGKLGKNIRFIKIYSATSPCPRCCTEILECVSASEIERVDLKWGRILGHGNDILYNAARELLSHPKIIISVMSESDYAELDDQVYPTESRFYLDTNCKKHGQDEEH